MPVGAQPSAWTGEARMDEGRRVTLPEQALTTLGWQAGDGLLVTVLSPGTMVLMRRRENWTEAFAGCLGTCSATTPRTRRTWPTSAAAGTRKREDRGGRGGRPS